MAIAKMCVCVCEYVRKSESANLAQVTKIHLRDLGCKVNETLGLERQAEKDERERERMVKQEEKDQPERKRTRERER